MVKRNLTTNSNASPNKKAKTVTDASKTLTRELTERQMLEMGSCINIVSSNVAGFRSILKNEDKKLKFMSFVKKSKPDILCLQEHKLQESHINDVKADLDEMFPEYSRYFTCSGPPAKKGYSGVSIFIKNKATSSQKTHKPKQKTITDMFSGKTLKKKESNKKSSTSISSSSIDGPSDSSNSASEAIVEDKKKHLNVLSVTYGLGKKYESDNVATYEGRVITIELPSMFLINCYVPNSGQGLVRLDYRVNSWDVHFCEYMHSLESRGKPVVLIGDLNVAHRYEDMHNFYGLEGFPNELPWTEDAYKKKAKALLKQAGCTVAERNSFTKILESGFVDSFRWFHPKAQGCFTYWSVRAGNRRFNRGLRLDYALVSKSMLNQEEIKKEDDADGSTEMSSISCSDARIVDSYILDDEEEFPGFSDHCPMGCVIQFNTGTSSASAK